jgi:hypothetical protein
VADPSGAGTDIAEPDDLFVLCGEPGQGLAAEVGELVDRLLRLGEPFPELGVFCLEPGDLGLASLRSAQFGGSGVPAGLKVQVSGLEAGEAAGFA